MKRDDPLAALRELIDEVPLGRRPEALRKITRVLRAHGLPRAVAGIFGDITHDCGHCGCSLYEDGSVCRAPASFCARCGTPSGHKLCDKCQTECWEIVNALPKQKRTAADPLD